MAWWRLDLPMLTAPPRSSSIDRQGATSDLLVERMAQLPVVGIDAPLVRAAIATSGACAISYWDALIVAAAEAAGCRRILSEDLSHGETYGSVRVENPFLDMPAEAGRQ